MEDNLKSNIFWKVLGIIGAMAVFIASSYATVQHVRDTWQEDDIEKAEALREAHMADLAIARQNYIAEKSQERERFLKEQAEQKAHFQKLSEEGRERYLEDREEVNEVLNGIQSNVRILSDKLERNNIE